MGKLSKRNFYHATASVIVSLLISCNSFAGVKTESDVSIRGAEFSGSFADARASSDSKAELACLFNASMAYCYAKNSTDMVGCFSSDPLFMDLVKAMSDSSSFTVRHSEGQCVSVLVGKASYKAPKVK